MHFASSISDEKAVELIQGHLSDLPEQSFYWARDPSIWGRMGRGHERRETKILATSTAVSFDEEINPEGYVKIPAPAPEFLNATRRHAKARWINLISPAHLDFVGKMQPLCIRPISGRPTIRGLLPAKSDNGERDALPQQHAIGYSLLKTRTIGKPS